jgi:hypothetical protein
LRSTPVTGRALADAYGPASLSLVRWSLSGLIIAAIALARWRAERWRAPRARLARIAVLGVANAQLLFTRQAWSGNP